MVTMSMSELCRKKNAFSAQVSKGPVLITKRGKTAFVAVPYEVWKTLKPRKSRGLHGHKHRQHRIRYPERQRPQRPEGRVVLSFCQASEKHLRHTPRPLLSAHVFARFFGLECSESTVLNAAARRVLLTRCRTMPQTGVGKEKQTNFWRRSNAFDSHRTSRCR